MACGDKGDVNWGGGWSMVGSGVAPDEIFGEAPARPARAPGRQRWGSQHTWQLVALLMVAAFLIYRRRS